MATNTSKRPRPSSPQRVVQLPCPKCNDGEMHEIDNDTTGAQQCDRCRYTTARWGEQAVAFDSCPRCHVGEMLSPDGTDRWTECTQCGHTVNATKW